MLHRLFSAVLALICCATISGAALAQRGGEHSFEAAIADYQQHAQAALAHALRKRKPCNTQLKLQVNPNGQIIAMKVDQSDCPMSEQTRMSKLFAKITLPRFKDLFLHHSKGRLPILQVNIADPNSDAPGTEGILVQCLWNMQE